ncbi:hypothetical protein ACHHYP_03267 [Achlya hypogyna]|uniref:Uncharacterized protein n=1 Tax=Achlya hypogyna TaxID=1202772 RepID=A0A1V9ZRL6_ACHHY|nr:hypothetical protein ACHHYP_03267 [Achlya hypogyna]
MRQVLLVLTGHSTAQSSSGRAVELYHVTLKDNGKARHARIRNRALRKHLKPILEAEGLPTPLPRKFIVKGSSHEGVVRDRVRCVRYTFADSHFPLADNTVVALHRMMDDATSGTGRLTSNNDKHELRQGPSLPDELLHGEESDDDHQCSHPSLAGHRSASFSHLDDDDESSDQFDNNHTALRKTFRPKLTDNRLFMSRPSALCVPPITGDINPKTRAPVSEEDATFIEELAQSMLSRLRQRSPSPRHSVLRQVHSEPWLPIEPLDRAQERIAEWASGPRLAAAADESAQTVIKDVCATYFPNIHDGTDAVREPSPRQLTNQRLMGFLPQQRGTKVSPMRRNQTY